jgi:hypothetical protein
LLTIYWQIENQVACCGTCQPLARMSVTSESVNMPGLTQLRQQTHPSAWPLFRSDYPAPLWSLCSLSYISSTGWSPTAELGPAVASLDRRQSHGTGLRWAGSRPVGNVLVLAIEAKCTNFSTFLLSLPI